MPRFNRLGDWTAGVGGDGVYALVNGQIIDPGPGGAGDWLSDDEFVGARWTTWDDFRAVAISKTGVQRELQHGVFNHVYGGGGRWGVCTREGRFLLDDGSESLPIVGFGRDGCLVTWAHSAGGFIIAGRKVSDAVVYESHVLDANTAIWIEHGAPKTIGMPVPTLLPGPVHGLRVAFDGSRWWALYQAEYNGRLVLHPFDSFDGYALNQTFDPRNSATWAYRPDLVILGGMKHVIWATIESEQIGQIAGPYVADVEFPLVDVRGSEGVPPPPPDDKKEPPVSNPNHLEDVKRIRAKYDTPLGARHWQFLVELAQAIGARLFRKDGGTNILIPALNVHVSQDIIVMPNGEGFDVLGDGEGAATPGWDSKGQMVGEFVDVSGVKLDDSPVVVGGGGGTQPQTSGFADAAAALEARIAGIAAAVDALKSVVDELKQRPVVKPEAVNLDGLKIALRTDNGHFLSAQDGGGGVVHTQRPEPGQPTEGYNPGAWETFQIVSR
jgi:hypothetical protein